MTLTGATLSGAASGNYTLTSVATDQADITALGITGSFTAANKVYDGNAVAGVGIRTLTGAIAGDVVSLTGGTAAFSDANAGNGKTVTLTRRDAHRRGLDQLQPDVGQYGDSEYCGQGAHRQLHGGQQGV